MDAARIASRSPCDFLAGARADSGPAIRFLLDTVNSIATSKAWTGNSVIFIVWDESDFTGTGPEGFWRHQRMLQRGIRVAVTWWGW